MSYYTKPGFSGLTGKSQLKVIFVFLFSFIIFVFYSETQWGGFFINKPIDKTASSAEKLQNVGKIFVNSSEGEKVFAIIIRLVSHSAFAGVFSILFLIFFPLDRKLFSGFYCADCGQFLGISPQACPRCGCNRYSSEDSGVGRTVRNR